MDNLRHIQHSERYPIPFWHPIGISLPFLVKTLETPLNDAQHSRRQKDAKASFFYCLTR